MTEHDTIRLLQVIRDLALIGYPYPGDAPPIADGLVLCLGQIGGLASRALAEHEPQIRAAPNSYHPVSGPTSNP